MLPSIFSVSTDISFFLSFARSLLLESKKEKTRNRSTVRFQNNFGSFRISRSVAECPLGFGVLGSVAAKAEPGRDGPSQALAGRRDEMIKTCERIISKVLISAVECYRRARSAAKASRTTAGLKCHAADL